MNDRRTVLCLLPRFVTGSALSAADVEPQISVICCEIKQTGLCVSVTVSSWCSGPVLAHCAFTSLPPAREGQKETGKGLLWAEGIKYEKEMNKKESASSFFSWSWCGVEVVCDNLIRLWQLAERDKRGQGALKVWWAADCRAVRRRDSCHGNDEWHVSCLIGRGLRQRDE